MNSKDFCTYCNQERHAQCTGELCDCCRRCTNDDCIDKLWTYHSHDVETGDMLLLILAYKQADVALVRDEDGNWKMPEGYRKEG